MPIRPSVETWNRGELEDKFYRQYDQLIAVKKRNNELEKKLKLSSSRIRQALESGNASETEERNRELERENRLLAQKLKALRHQLIAYTRPQAHNTTLSFLTSRSTGRPRSGIPAESGRPHQTQQPEAATPLPETRQKPPVEERHVQVISPRHPIPESQLIPTTATEEKQQIIRLFRDNREKEEEISELQFKLTKNEEKLENLRTEYDRIIQDLENSNQKVGQLQRAANQKPQESSTELLEKEMAIMKQENKVLKAANERFVHNSLIDSQSSKEVSIELQNLQKHIHDLEMKVIEIEAENKHLTKRLKSAESEKKSLSSKYKKLKEKASKATGSSTTMPNNILQQEKIQEEEEEESDEAASIPESPIPKKSSKGSKRRHSNHHRSSFEPSVLDKVFEDVASIVNSHISRTESSASLDNELGVNAKWRHMYESVYSELEKLRNLLMIQHRVNERHKKEIQILNDSNDSNKHEYEKKLGEFVLELNRRAKRIEILENQLRSIANGATDFDRSVLSQPSEKSLIDIPASISTTEMTLRLKKLTITEAGLKHMGSVDPMLFLSLEFFDFEFQTTPLIQGPEGVFEYLSVYDIVVSNLFIHYIETEGITIEVFEVKGIAYEQKGSGTISLKKLLETETPAMISGKLRLLLPGTKDTVIAQLEYQLEVPFSLIKALKAQKRRLTASTYLPMDSSLPSTLYNEVEILIHRCSSLQALTKNSKQPPTTYVAYQIYDLPPHLTQIQNKNFNPVFNDSRALTLPLGASLHRYLKTEELQIYVVEESSDKMKASKELGSVVMPLFPLARNQSIKGTFPLIASDGKASDATIDLSIYWKYAYTFNDEMMEVEQPIPVKFPKWKPIPQESPKIVEPENPKSPPKENNQQQYFQSPGHRRPAPLPPSQAQHQSSEELPQPAVPSNVPHLSVPSSSSASLDDSSSAEETVIENTNHVDEVEIPSPEPPAIIESDEASDSDDTYVVDDDDMQDSELQKKVRETSIDEIPDIPRDDETESEPSTTKKQPQPESSPTPPPLDDAHSSQKEDDAENAEKEDMLRRLTKTSPPTASSSDESDSSEAPEIIGLKEELEKLGKEIEDDSKIVLPKPPLRLPPIAPPRKSTAKIEFKDPLHSSIPPSEESSIAGSISGSPRPRERTIYKSKPDLAALASSPSIRHFQQPFRSDIQHIDCSVMIRLGRLSLVEHSPLLHENYENLNVFVEWSFLDFPSDLCETPESVPLPRNTWKVETFECERIYELNSRRTALLKQWIELNTRLSFNLVSDPQDGDGDCDDLGVAQMDLSDAINTSVHSIVFHDVDGEPIAVLDLSVVYSDELTKILTDGHQEE